MQVINFHGDLLNGFGFMIKIILNLLLKLRVIVCFHFLINVQ